VSKPLVLVVSEVEQAVNALDFSVELLERSTTAPQYWRWALLALHQAVQGFMVCALAGSDGTRPLNHEKRDVREYIKALRKYSVTGQYPELPARALDRFLNLYKKVKNANVMRQYTTSQAFIPRRGFQTRIEDLNTFRNEFQHFTPKKWVVEVAVFLEPAQAAIQLIDFLAFKSHNIVWRAHPGKKELVRRRLNKARAVLSSMEAQYGVSQSSEALS
jgi:hypothetical protein